MNRRELEMHLQDLFEGCLESEALESLQQELRSNPEAQDAYRDYAHLHNALQLRAEGVDLLNVVPMDRVVERRQRRSLEYAGLAAVALLILIGVVMALILTRTPPPTLSFDTSPGTDLSMSHQLAGEDAPEGQTLEPGSRLEIRRGTVELEFASGVRGIVRGPAELSLRHEDFLDLALGTVWFSVPPEAVGFKVQTPDLLLTDLGTEFGILSKPHLLDEVHVFTGKVDVRNRYGLKTRELVGTGEARVAGPAGRWRKIPLRKEHFLTELPTTEPDMQIRATSAPRAPELDHSFGTLELALNLGDGGALVRDGIPFQNSEARGALNETFGAANGIEIRGTPEDGDDVSFAGLIGWWDFNDGNAAAGPGGIKDLATDDGSHDATLSDAGGSFSNDVPTSLAGVGSRSLDLTGGGYALVDAFSGGASDADFNSGKALSVSFWLKGYPSGSAEPDVWNPFVSKGGETDGWQIRRRSIGNQCVFTLRGTTADPDPAGPMVGPNPGWTHLTATYDGSRRKLYVNGRLSIDIPDSGTISDASDLVSFCAINNGHRQARVLLDDIGIWKMALTPATVEALANGVSPIPDSSTPTHRDGFRNKRLSGPQTPDYDPLFHSRTLLFESQTRGLADGSTAWALSVAGLDSARRYQVQILFAEPRESLAYDCLVTATDGSGHSESAELVYGPGQSPQAFALATIKLKNSTSLRLEMPDTRTMAPAVSGVVIHSAPASTDQ